MAPIQSNLHRTIELIPGEEIGVENQNSKESMRVEKFAEDHSLNLPHPNYSVMENFGEGHPMI